MPDVSLSYFSDNSALILFLSHQWRSQPKNCGGGNWGGAECMILGEQHYFVWKNASQSTK